MMTKRHILRGVSLTIGLILIGSSIVSLFCVPRLYNGGFFWNYYNYTWNLGDVSTDGWSGATLVVHKHGNPPVLVGYYDATYRSILLVIFTALAVGVFLVSLPWIRRWWDRRRREVPGFQVLPKRRDMPRKGQS